MACFWFNQNETSIKITKTVQEAEITFYEIQVSVGDVKWELSRRYSEFFNMHNKLVCDHGVAKDILPPKRFLGRFSIEFIEQRMHALEEYLNKLLIYFKITMPVVFVEFLNFNLYDIYFIVNHLAVRCQDDIIEKGAFTLSTIHVNAINERFTRPFPIRVDTVDISNFLEICGNLELFTLKGSSKNYLKSNVVPNSLPFELTQFKKLKNLNLIDVDLNQISTAKNLRQHLKTLNIHSTKVQNINEILLCDRVDKKSFNKTLQWTQLVKLDLSNNNLSIIDESIQIVPNLRTLILDSNKFTSIPGLSALHNLVKLSMASNLIRVDQDDQLHVKLGNVNTLNLAQNRIVMLKGFRKLLSISQLDLSGNFIEDINQVEFISKLPLLEELSFTGNVIATLVDYRSKVFSYFETEQAVNLCLDNEKSAIQELDFANVHKALRVLTDGAIPKL